MTTKDKPVAAVDGHAERLMRLREVARRLAVSDSMAWKLIASGELRAIRIGRAVRVRPSEVEAYIARAEDAD